MPEPDNSVIIVDAEATDTEATDTEATDTEAADTEAADTEAADTEAADTEATDTEATDTEATDTEATDTEATDTEATDTEATDTEATDTEAVKNLKAEIVALKEKLTVKEEPKPPEIPDLPNMLDTDFEAKIAERDAIIAQRAKIELQKELDLKYKVEAAQQKVALEVSNLALAFDKRAKEFKLDTKDLLEEQNIVGKGIPGKQNLARFLLKEEEGPLIVSYLAKNGPELKKIGKMTETDAVAYILKTVASKAKGLKPRTTKAPAPSTKITGKASGKTTDPALAGCTFF
jgi:hypothetical protein